MTRATLRASILSWGGLKNYFEKVPLRDRELVECGLRKQQLKGSVILFLGPGALKTCFFGACSEFHNTKLNFWHAELLQPSGTFGAHSEAS